MKRKPHHPREPAMTEAARIAEAVQERFPQVIAVHLGGDHPLYIGTWYFRWNDWSPLRPASPNEVVLETATGTYPFCIRLTRDEPGDGCVVESFESAVAVVAKFLHYHVIEWDEIFDVHDCDNT